MKKIFLLSLLLTSINWLNAQGLKDTIPENSLLAFYLRFTALFLFLALAGYFIITIIQQNMNHQIRKKIIEHNIAEPLATKLLSADKKNRKREVIKWMLVTTSLVLGILVASYVQPYGPYTIVIILLSLSIAFLIYYQVIKKDNH